MHSFRPSPALLAGPALALGLSLAACESSSKPVDRLPAVIETLEWGIGEVEGELAGVRAALQQRDLELAERRGLDARAYEVDLRVRQLRAMLETIEARGDIAAVERATAEITALTAVATDLRVRAETAPLASSER